MEKNDIEIQREEVHIGGGDSDAESSMEEDTPKEEDKVEEDEEDKEDEEDDEEDEGGQDVDSTLMIQIKTREAELEETKKEFPWRLIFDKGKGQGNRQMYFKSHEEV